MPSYFFLPSQKVTLLLIPYHFTIPPTSKNSIFIKILLFNLFLLFFYPIFYFRRDSISWAFQLFLFFLSLPQPLAKTTNTYHQTHAVSVGAASTTTLSLNRFFFPQSPLTSSTNHKHKQTQTHAVSVSLPQPRHQTIKPTKPPVRNPRRRFETQPI